MLNEIGVKTEVDLALRTEALIEATYIVDEERRWITLFQSQVPVGTSVAVEWQPRQVELLRMFAAQPAN